MIIENLSYMCVVSRQLGRKKDRQLRHRLDRNKDRKLGHLKSTIWRREEAQAKVYCKPKPCRFLSHHRAPIRFLVKVNREATKLTLLKKTRILSHWHRHRQLKQSQMQAR